MQTEAKQLTENQINDIETVLSKGNRVELIPVKSGVKVMLVRREEIKNGGDKYRKTGV